MNSHDELMPFDLPKKVLEKSKRIIIKVIGVGGGGGNAVNNMYKAGIENVDFVIANTDIQVLEKSDVPKKIQLGVTLTEGLGAGNNPETGKNAATESKQDIIDLLDDGTKMVFITAGMGGGTGTGAAPVIAQTAKELGILTIGIVTIPFLFEGLQRVEQAINGMNQLKQHVDAMIVIDNEKISEVYGEYDVEEGFKSADLVLTIAAKGIAEIITKPGLVNVDFADVKSVMKESGVAVMGTAYGQGEKRSLIAVKEAINSPLLNNNDIRGAKNLLVNIISPAENKISMDEIKYINRYLQAEAGNKANLIWGVTIDENLEKDQAAVTVVATDFNDNIIPSIEEIMKDDFKLEDDTNNQNNVQQNIDNQKYEQNDKEKSIDKIKESIKSFTNNRFDYNDEKNVDDYDETPAYLRQKLKIDLKSSPIKKNRDTNNNNNNNFRDLSDDGNNFLNPMMD